MSPWEQVRSYFNTCKLNQTDLDKEPSSRSTKVVKMQCDRDLNVLFVYGKKNLKNIKSSDNIRIQIFPITNSPIPK